MEEYVFIEKVKENSYIVVADEESSSSLIPLSYHKSDRDAYKWTREYTTKNPHHRRVYVMKCLIGFHCYPRTRRK